MIGSTWWDTLTQAAALHGHGWGDVIELFSRFGLLSLLGFGGAISTAPEMRRFLVDERAWLDGRQFTDAIALAQAAPGPNVLFIALLGWSVAGLAGAVATMVGILLPCTVLAVAAGRWGRRHAQRRGVKAFSAGLVPLTVGLTVASGWLLALPVLPAWPGWPLAGAPDVGLARIAAPAMLLLAAAVGTAVGKGRPLAWIATGAALGALGWV